MSKLLIATRRVEHLDAEGRPKTTLAGGVISNLTKDTYDLLKGQSAGRDLTEAELALYEKMNPKPKPKPQSKPNSDSGNSGSGDGDVDAGDDVGAGDGAGANDSADKTGDEKTETSESPRRRGRGRSSGVV